MEKQNPLKRIWNSRLFLILLSLSISLVLWVYVVSTETTETTQIFRGIPVELVGETSLRESRNLVVTDFDISTVSVEIKGPRRIVNSLDSRDLTAQVDVSKITQAAYASMKYTIVYPDTIDTRSISEVSYSPETVNFMVSQLVSATIPVRGGFEGQCAEGYTAEPPTFEPSTITVTGPETYVKNISYAWVSFGEGIVAESTYSVDTGFTLMDSDGNPLSTEYLSFSDDTIRATLPILEVKEIPLSVELIEGAGATAANTKVTITPEKIVLAGDSGILSGMNRILLATISLTDFNTTFSDSFNITFDNNLMNLTGVSEAKVDVEIIGLETRTFSISNISCINSAEGTEVEIITENLDVTIRGTADQLDAIKNENIRAVADLTDYKDSTGSYMPTVKIYVDGFTDVGAIGEYTISITISKA